MRKSNTPPVQVLVTFSNGPSAHLLFGLEIGQQHIPLLHTYQNRVLESSQGTGVLLGNPHFERMGDLGENAAKRID